MEILHVFLAQNVEECSCGNFADQNSGLVENCNRRAAGRQGFGSYVLLVVMRANARILAIDQLGQRSTWIGSEEVHESDGAHEAALRIDHIDGLERVESLLEQSRENIANTLVDAGLGDPGDDVSSCAFGIRNGRTFGHEHAR
jgi:hypothetical protein